MSEEISPQPAPQGEADTGKGEPDGMPLATPADSGQAMQERLDKLERSYQEAQRVIGRQGQELGELRKRGSATASQEENLTPENFFSDPVNATRKVMSQTLSEFEQRQEQKRQAERYLRTFAENNEVSESDLYRWNDEYEQAANDPEARLNLLMEIKRARNASTEIQKAAQTAKDSAVRNARAVTSESTAAHVSPPGKSFDDMTGDEMRVWIKKNLGVAEWQ